VLVDAGVSAIQLRRRLEAFGRSPDDVDAVLLTHEHSDHVRGLDVFLRRHRAAPVWATNGTWSQVGLRSNGGGELLSGRELILGCLRIVPVATSHDAAEPVALLIDDGCHRTALCTDTGIFTGLLERRLAGCDLLLLETNHDKDMLRHGPYPWPLKQRIDSRLGHLSNHQSEEAVVRLRSPALQAVVGLHLSAENNCPEMVCATLREAVGDELPVTAVTRGSMLHVTISNDGARLEPRELPPGPGR